MALDVTLLTARQVVQRTQAIAQDFEANRRYFTGHQPVADLTALAALAAPVEGEERLITSELPRVVKYVYHSTVASPLVTPDDGSAGGWVNANPASLNEMWVADFDYVAGDIFDFISDTDTVDAEGNEVKAGVLYGGVYVDTAGALVDTTSGSTLDAAEIAKIKIEDGIATDQVYTQAQVDAIITD